MPDFLEEPFIGPVALWMATNATPEPDLQPAPGEPAAFTQRFSIRERVVAENPYNVVPSLTLDLLYDNGMDGEYTLVYLSKTALSNLVRVGQQYLIEHP